MYPLTFQRVRKRHGHKPVVEDLYFTIVPGRFTGFLAPMARASPPRRRSFWTSQPPTTARPRSAGPATGSCRIRPGPWGHPGALLPPRPSGRAHLRILADASGIPPGRVDEMLELVGLAGAPVIVSSHLLAEVEHLAVGVVVLDRGRLVTKGALSYLQKAGTSMRTPTPEPLVQILEGDRRHRAGARRGISPGPGLSQSQMDDHAKLLPFRDPTSPRLGPR